jgi:hypothetical protein
MIGEMSESIERYGAHEPRRLTARDRRLGPWRAFLAAYSLVSRRLDDDLRAEHGTLLAQPKNVASFAQDADGELYVLAFDDKIYSLVVPEGN